MKEADTALSEQDRPNINYFVKYLEQLDAFKVEYSQWLTQGEPSTDKSAIKEKVVMLAEQFNLTESSEVVYSSVWNEIDEKLGLDWGLQKPDIPIALFVDLRGIILPAARSSAITVGNPRGRSRKSEPAALLDIELQRRCGWPILRASEGNDTRPLANRDVVACTMHHEASVYLSTQGNAPHRMESVRHRHAAIRYLVLSEGKNRWANGRLVDTLNRLETYRSLALRGISELRDIGNLIKSYGLQLDGIASYISRMNDDNLDTGKLELEEFFDRLQGLVTATPGGLPYRIYRSNTYSSSFRSLLSQLDVGEIDGYQRYDLFVERQAFGIFEFIRALGSRLQNLRDRYLVLVELIEMKSASAMQRERNQIAKSGVKIENFATAYYVGYPLLALVTGIYSLALNEENGWSKFSYGVITALVFAALYVFFLAGHRLWDKKHHEAPHKDDTV